MRRLCDDTDRGGMLPPCPRSGFAAAAISTPLGETCGFPRKAAPPSLRLAKRRKFRRWDFTLDFNGLNCHQTCARSTVRFF